MAVRVVCESPRILSTGDSRGISVACAWRAQRQRGVCAWRVRVARMAFPWRVRVACARGVCAWRVRVALVGSGCTKTTFLGDSCRRRVERLSEVAMYLGN